MRNTDLDYYERRLAEETARANSSELDCVRSVHLESAELYRKRIEKLTAATRPNIRLKVLAGGRH